MSILTIIMPEFGKADTLPDGVNIRLTGNIVALSCTVDPADVDKTVNLGNWSIKQLQYPNGYSEPVAFYIRLTGCSASGVILTFTGKKDDTDNTLLALSADSTAKGVAVEIMDSNQNKIALDSNSKRKEIDENGNVTLSYLARYVAVSQPTSGTAYADSEFSLTYD